MGAPSSTARGSKHRRSRALEATARSGNAQRYRWASVVAAVALVLLAGCAIQLGQVRTENAVYNAGFADTTISSHAVGGRTTITLSADHRTAHGSVGAQARSVAKAVWANLPGRFDRLTVRIHGVGTRTFTRGQLVVLFGPRAVTLDQGTVSGRASSDGAVVALVVFGVLAVVAALVVYLISRYRRQQRRSATSRTALLMATIPQELWAAADGAQGLPVGPAPPPPVPPQYPQQASAGHLVSPPSVPPTPIPPIPRAVAPPTISAPPRPEQHPPRAPGPVEAPPPGAPAAPPPAAPAVQPPVAPWPGPPRERGARDQPAP